MNLVTYILFARLEQLSLVINLITKKIKEKYMGTNKH